MAREAELHGDPEMLVDAMNGLAIMLYSEGCPTAYIALLERCVTVSRESHLVYGLGRSLSNMGGYVYPSDLSRARELLGEALTVCRQVGDSYITEVAVQNAAFAGWLAGEWDKAEAILTDWLDGRPVTSATGTHLAMLDLIAMARGRELLTHGELPDVEDPYAQYGKDHFPDSRGAAAGDGAAAERLAAAAERVFNGTETDDFEVLWPPAVDLQLRTGDVDRAEQLLGLAAPFMGARMRPALRCEHLRLRAAIASARGEDPEALLREAEQASHDYGAPFLLARVRLQLGRWFIGRGRSNEATPCLAAARRGFVELARCRGSPRSTCCNLRPRVRSSEPRRMGLTAGTRRAPTLRTHIRTASSCASGGRPLARRRACSQPRPGLRSGSNPAPSSSVPPGASTAPARPIPVWCRRAPSIFRSTDGTRLESERHRLSATGARRSAGRGVRAGFVEAEDLDGLALAVVLGGDGIECGDGGGVPDVGVRSGR